VQRIPAAGDGAETTPMAVPGLTSTPPRATMGEMATNGRKRLRTFVVGVRSVRVRVLTLVLLLTALGMALAGTAVYMVQNTRLERQVKREVEREADEFEKFQATGIDPRTGRPFSSLERLFLVALEGRVPPEHEALLAVVDEEVLYHSPGASAERLSIDPEFLDEVDDVIDDDEPAYQDVKTGTGQVHIAVRPVSRGGEEGAWVIAHWTESEETELLGVVRTYATISLGALSLVAVVGWFVAGRLLAPIRLLRRTAQQITDTDLTQRIRVTGHDDVSELAHTFNIMLDRLEEAFTTQRQFLDDAGHELRTPITVIRGHLELLDGSDPAEVEEVRMLVIDELDRMTRMVDDLVMLARAERPDFLHVAKIDLGRLVDDVFGKARALGDRRWRLDARAEALIHGDRQRLTQALLELTRNAVALTRENDMVALGSAVDEATGIVRLWVRDTGPGVAPADAVSIFDRFHRGTLSHSDGSGLGLAIVRAIAEAHGGRVVLSSSLRHGATFTLVLPPGHTEERARPQTPKGHPT
jgi:signal transduction histidine kinase